MHRKIIAMGVILLLISGGIINPLVSHAENKDRKEIKEELTQAEKELATIIKEKEQLETEVAELNDSLEINEEAMEEVNEEIGELEKEIQLIEDQIEERFDILKERAKSYQTNGGNIQYLEVLLGAASFTEFISRLTAVTTIVDADAKLIEEQEADKRKVEMKLSELEALQDELIEMEKLITEQKEVAIDMQDDLESKSIELNNLIKDLQLKDNQLATIEASVTTQGPAPVTQQTVESNGALGWPAQGGYISSYMGARWGKMHKGIDIARTDRSTSPPILAAESGTVETATFNHGGYGNLVVINHGNGLKTFYAHLASLNVSAGQTVSKGEKLGIMGTTGNSTGIHLHFEVHVNGTPQDPMIFLR